MQRHLKIFTSQFKKCWRQTPHGPLPLSPAAIWHIWLWNVARLTCTIWSQAFFNQSQDFSDLIRKQSRQSSGCKQSLPPETSHMDWAVLYQSLRFCLSFHRCKRHSLNKIWLVHSRVIKQSWFVSLSLNTFHGLSPRWKCSRNQTDLNKNVSFGMLHIS